MQKSTKFTGLILAGGTSSRFGNDKAVHLVGDIPMIRRVFDALSPICSEILIGISAGQQAAYDLPARYVADCYEGIGPVAGIHAGMMVMRTEWMLVVACDLPYIKTQSVRRIADCCEGEARAVVAVAPDGRKQPLCAGYRHMLFPLIESRINAQRYGLQGLIEVAQPQINVCLEGRDLTNVNRLSDLLDD